MASPSYANDLYGDMMDVEEEEEGQQGELAPMEEIPLDTEFVLSVQDHSRKGVKPQVHKVQLNTGDTLDELRASVGRRVSRHVDDFRMAYHPRGGEATQLESLNGATTLASLGVHTKGGFVMVSSLAVEEDEEEEGEGTEEYYDATEMRDIVSYPYTTYNHYEEHNRWKKRSECGYVAINNPFFAHYLSSVLQALYCTPEVRAMVYEWRFEESGLRASESLVRQLQLLFARLQHDEVRFTASDGVLFALGWDSRAHFAEREAHEFLAALVARCEEEFAGTPLAGRLTNLFGVTMSLWNECPECAHRSAPRTEVALEIVVNPTSAEGGFISSLAEGLAALVAPEVISDYTCEGCHKSVAIRRCRSVVSTGALVCVRLDIFQYSELVRRRAKIRTFLKFPEELHGSDVLPEGSALELQSVLAHEGTSLAGHYYALCKAKGKWISMSDSKTRDCSFIQVQDCYGFSPGSDSGSDDAAYMLFYRSGEAPADPKAPAALRALVRKEAETRREHARVNWAVEKDLSWFTVIYEDHKRLLSVSKARTTLDALTVMAAEAFGIDAIFARSHYRLRRFEKYHKIPSTTFGNSLAVTVKTSSLYGDETLLLETRDVGSPEFEECNVGDMALKVSFFSVEGSKPQFSPPELIYVPGGSSTGTLKDVRLAIEAKFAIPLEEQRIFHESSSYGLEEVLGDNSRLYSLRIYTANLLYVERSSAPSSSPSPCLAELERVKNCISISYSPVGESALSGHIELDKRFSIYVVKEILAARHSIADIDSFTVMRPLPGSLVHLEVKDEDQTLKDLFGHSAKATLYLQAREAPAADALVSVQLKHFKVEKKGYVYEDVQVLQVPRNSPIERLKEMAVPGEPADRVRLRLISGGSPSHILAPGCLLSEAVESLYDGIAVVVQVLPAPETKTRQNVVPLVRRLHSDWTLSEAREVPAPCDMGMQEFRVLLASAFELSVEDLTFAMCIGSLSVLEMMDLEFDPVAPRFIKRPSTVTSVPLCLCDGDCIVVRDKNEQMRDLSDQEKLSIINGV